MRTAEVALGLLIMLAAAALVAGAASLVAPVPPLGLGPALAIVAGGAALAAHGMSGLARKSDAAASALRWRQMTIALIAITLAAALPVLVGVLDLVSLAGFPLGYYLASQGLLLVFAILGFRVAARKDAAAMPLEEPPANEAG